MLEDGFKRQSTLSRRDTFSYRDSVYSSSQLNLEVAKKRKSKTKAYLFTQIENDSPAISTDEFSDTEDRNVPMSGAEKDLGIKEKRGIQNRWYGALFKVSEKAFGNARCISVERFS